MLITIAYYANADAVLSITDFLFLAQLFLQFGNRFD
jgi:hypothetical protein